MSDDETIYDKLQGAQDRLDAEGLPWEVSSSRQYNEVTFTATRRGTYPRTVAHPHAKRLVELVAEEEARFNPTPMPVADGLANSGTHGGSGRDQSPQEEGPK
jgi:hypothetical protein